MKYAIFDIDGCCIDNSLRLHLLDPTDNNAAFHHAYHLDTPIQAGVKVYAALMRSGVTGVFLTSRHESHRDYTATQLRQLFGVELLARNRSELLMRLAEDTEPDPVFKLKALAREGIHPSDVLIAFDDRPSIVAAYREAGIVAYQTAEGW